MPSDLMNDVAQGQLVQKRIDQAVATARHLYSCAEQSNLPLVKASLDTTTWITRPVVDTVARVGQPVVQKLDNTLSNTYARWNNSAENKSAADENNNNENNNNNSDNNKSSTALMHAGWFQTVDQALQQTQARVSVSLRAFVDAAVEAYTNTVAQRSFDSFVSALKTQLSAWDERFLAPAKVFYAHAQERLASFDLREESVRRGAQVRQSLTELAVNLQQVWQQHTQAAVDNAGSLYHTALEQYLKLAQRAREQALIAVSATNSARSITEAENNTSSSSSSSSPSSSSASISVSVVELIAAMRTRLGGAWNDRLIQPLTEFATAAKQLSLQDLDRLRLAQQEQLQLQAQQASNSIRSVVRGVSGFVERRLDAVLTYSEQALEYYLPEQQQQQQQEKQEQQQELQEQQQQAAMEEDDQVAEEQDAEVEAEGEGEEQQPEQQEQEQQQDGENANNNNRTVVFRLRSLGSNVSKRLRKRATVQLGALREFSAARLRTVVHVDLIAYAENVIDQAQRSVKPSVSAAHQTLTESLARAQVALKDVKEHVHTTAESTMQQHVQPRLAQLKVKLQQAKTEAAALNQVTCTAVCSRKLVQLHTDFFHLALKTVGLESDPEFAAYTEKVKQLLHTLAELTVCWMRVDENQSVVDDAQAVQEPAQQLY